MSRCRNSVSCQSRVASSIAEAGECRASIQVSNTILDVQSSDPCRGAIDIGNVEVILWQGEKSFLELSEHIGHAIGGKLKTISP